MAYIIQYETSSYDENDTFSRGRPTLRSDRYSLPPTPAPQQPTTSIEHINTPLTPENIPTFSGFRQAVITPLEPEMTLSSQEPDELFQESAEYDSVDVKTRGKIKVPIWQTQETFFRQSIQFRKKKPFAKISEGRCYLSYSCEFPSKRVSTFRTTIKTNTTSTSTINSRNIKRLLKNHMRNLLLNEIFSIT